MGARLELLGVPKRLEEAGAGAGAGAGAVDEPPMKANAGLGAAVSEKKKEKEEIMLNLCFFNLGYQTKAKHHSLPHLLHSVRSQTQAFGFLPARRVSQT